MWWSKKILRMTIKFKTKNQKIRKIGTNRIIAILTNNWRRKGRRIRRKKRKKEGMIHKMNNNKMNKRKNYNLMVRQKSKKLNNL